jgi:hypothetical protein
MSRGMFCLSVLSGVFILMAGCGGSSSSSSSGGSGGGGGNGGGGNGGGNSTNVTFAITGTPTAVATKIGSGSFTAATLTDGSLTLSLPDGTTNFAVAYVCPSVNVGSTTSQRMETNEDVVEASTLDGTSFSESCPVLTSTGSTGSTGTLTGSVDASAIPGSAYNFLNIYAENGTAESTGDSAFPSGSFSFAAPVGTDRVEVVDYGMTVGSSGEVQSVVAIKNFSGQAVPGALNGGSTVVLSAADQTVPEPITYQNVPTGFSAPTTNDYYVWSGGDSILVENAATSTYLALPAGAMETGDYYYFDAFATGSLSGATNGNGYEEVTVETTSTSSGPVSFSFPPAWTYAGPAAATWPSFNVAYSGFSSSADVCDQASMIWQPSPTVENVVVVAASGNYLSGSTTLAVPDLTSLTGFIAAPPSKTTVGWGANVLQSEYPCFKPSTLSNSTVKIVNNGGTYTTP